MNNICNENLPVIYIAPFDESTGKYKWEETALDILIIYLIAIPAAIALGWLIGALIGWALAAVGGFAGLTAFTVKATTLLKEATTLVVAAKGFGMAIA